MKISFVIPEGWLEYLVPELIDLRHEVLINKCTKDCDIILGMSHTQWRNIKLFHDKFPNIPLITLNWDWYDYINKSEYGWPEFIQLMKESKEIWANSNSTAERCEKDTGIKTDFIFCAYLLPWEWEGKNKDWRYILMASRQDPNKRFDWYKRATEELEIPYKDYHPEVNSREDYINTLKNCSFLIMASREESSGSLSCFEAAFCRKPILTSDNYGAKEFWGDDVIYFDKDNFDDFKKQMKWMWENYKSKEVQDKVERAYQKVKNHMPDIAAKGIDKWITKRIKSDSPKDIDFCAPEFWERRFRVDNNYEDAIQKVVSWEVVGKEQKKIMKKYIGGKVFDAGCGYGRIIDYLPEKVTDYVGMDITPIFIEEAKRRYPNHKFILGDIRKTDFKDKSFDWGIAIGITNGIYWLRMRKELKRICKKVLELECENLKLYRII